MASARHTRDARPLPPIETGRAPTPEPDAGRGLLWKHAIDRTLAALLILVTAPVMVVAALAARAAARGPVLIRERRIARDGRSFDLLAFREAPLLARVPVERLPELFNVLKGQMSFVGPRPERPEFVELFGENLIRYDRPRRVRPGITGWAQLRSLDGRAPLAERVRWDEYYVENWSLWLDAKIVLNTLRGVWRGPAGASGG